MNGACREMENCRFSHNFSNQPSMVCTYYQLGACSYGSNCRYDHTRPKRSQSAQKPSCSPYLQNSEVPGNSAAAASISLLKMSSLPVTNHMVTLHKSGTPAETAPATEFKVTGLPSKINADNWVKAEEFVPGQKWRGLAGPSSYLEAAQAGIADAPGELVLPSPEQVPESRSLCPFAAHGDCPYGSSCSYIHGEICELCGKAVLMPSDEIQNQKHTEECMREHERQMEAAFASQLSQDKVCGICMEVVWEKQPVSAQRFGVLSDCSHVFCLGCIRKWRAEDQYECEVVRACPECRVKSDFIIPSKFWVETKEDKIRLVDIYKKALSKKPCMHFQHGSGVCPFNDKCFYEHTYPDGRKASPQLVRRRQNAEGQVETVHKPSLWDFLSTANERRMELGNLLVETTDDDDELLSLTSLRLHDSSPPPSSAVSTTVAGD